MKYSTNHHGETEAERLQVRWSIKVNWAIGPNWQKGKKKMNYFDFTRLLIPVIIDMNCHLFNNSSRSL